MTAEPVTADPLIGEILAERYQLLERLGEGAMGTVYKARHIKVGRWFAVKVLHARLLEDSKTALRFEREAALAGRLRHANVVGVVDVGEVNGRHYMVMEFAEGPDLAELLSEAPMRPDRIINLIRQMLEGLYHAHEQGLIHRDLKPENVIIERDTHGTEMPRIVDFGIAILRDGGASSDGRSRLTTNGLVLGTPHYMAPEQAVADPIDHRIDLFALGIVIYEMLSGQLPFDGSGAEVARANLLLDPPPIKQRVPYLEVDPLLEAFARRLMAKKPSQRPATAKAARELLDLIERDRSAAADALGVPTRIRLPATTEVVAPQSEAPPAWPSPDQVSTAAIQVPTTPLATVELATSAMPTKQLRATPSPHRPLPAMANAPSGTSPPPVTSALALPSPGLSPIRNLASAGLGDRSRRLPFALAGIAICAAGIAGALWLFSAGDDADPPPLAVAPEGSAVAAPRAATATASPSIAEVTPPPAPASAPTPPAVSAAPPAPSATPPAAPEPDGELAANPKLVASRPVKRARSDGHSPERPSSGRPEATPLAAAIDASALVETHAAKPVVPAPAAEPVPPAAPHDSRSAANPADLVEPRLPATGVTPAAISELYSSIARALGRLAVDQSQDLRDRFRTFDIQALMLAAPAVRDAAVPSLLQLLRDARARKTSSPQPRSASHPSRRRVSGQDSPAEP